MKFLLSTSQEKSETSMRSTHRFDRWKRQPTRGRVLTAVVLMWFFGMLAVGKAASEWNLPADCETKKNPQPATEASLQEGKTIYEQNCLFCHGEGGAGDGQVAAMLDTKPSRFDEAEHMANENVGEFFCKISAGKEPMPGFAKKLTADQIWHTINYLWSFSAKKEK